MGWAIVIWHTDHHLCDDDAWARCRECCAEIKGDESRRRQRQVPVQSIREVHGITWIGGCTEDLSTGNKRCFLAGKLGPEERPVLPRRQHWHRLSSTRWGRCSSALSSMSLSTKSLSVGLPSSHTCCVPGRPRLRRPRRRCSRWRRWRRYRSGLRTTSLSLGLPQVPLHAAGGAGAAAGRALKSGHT